MVWTLFTCLWYAFLSDLNDPPESGPPCNHVYLPDHLVWRLGWTIVILGEGFMLDFIVVPELAIFSFFHIFL